MTKSIKKIYYLELIMLCYVIVLNIISTLVKSNLIIDTINMAFWIIMAIIILMKYHFPRDKDYLKGNTIRLIIITLLSFVGLLSLTIFHNYDIIKIRK